ncbi:MAG: hypothetical protein U9R15_05665 [Chloroflexota bacterium]|nr:hypothetical protein [Chloroflexota bacterium]
MTKVRMQVDIDSKDATLLELLGKRLSVQSQADLLQQAYGTFLWIVDEMLSGRHVISVETDALNQVERFKELSMPAVEPLRFQHYHYLVARPEKRRSQLYLKGRNMTVGQLIYKMRANQLSAEDAARDMDLPLEQVMEAMAYYEIHRDLIKVEAEEDKRYLLSRGVALEPVAVSG